MLSAPQGGTQRRWRNTRRPTPASTHFIYQYGSFMGKEKKISGSLPKRSPPHLSFVTCITATVILIHLFGTAGASIRAADTLLAALFCLIDIERGGCDNYHKNANYDIVDHQAFTPFSAYSCFRSLSAFKHNQVKIAANTITAMRPGTKPAPTSPVVIRVPIW